MIFNVCFYNRHGSNNLNIDQRERIPLAPRQPCFEPSLHPVVVVEMPTSTNANDVDNADDFPEDERLCSIGTKHSCSSRGSCPCEGCSCNSQCSSLDSPNM